VVNIGSFACSSYTLTLLFIVVPVSESASASSSEPSLILKPKPFDLKPDRSILPEKQGSKLTRYIKCEEIFLFFSSLISV